jgi:ABC-type cobalamin transport system ATPase subunit
MDTNHDVLVELVPLFRSEMLIKSPKDVIPVADAGRAFISWAEDRYHRGESWAVVRVHPTGQSTLTRYLTALGVRKGRVCIDGVRTSVLVGVRLADRRTEVTRASEPA